MDTMAVKEQICDVCHKMWQLGWVAANDGNVSVKMGDGTWWITPSGISKSFITPDKLIRVDSSMCVVEGPEGYRPSSEMKMHMRCYAEREDAGAVVHAHPPTATGYAVANKPLDEYSMIETVIAIAPFRYAIRNALYLRGTGRHCPLPEEHDVLLLQNHGALTVGCDLITAYYRMETLELYAKISLTAHLLGGAQEIPRPQIDKLLDLRENYYHITGKHPGYKKYTKEER